MAFHAPITGAPLRAPLQPTLMLANRKAIEAEIERLIDLLDAADAPLADLEAEEDFGVDDVPHQGEMEGLLACLPHYGEDQSAGPVNYEFEMRNHRAREMGLERSPTGGWRHATGGRA